MKARIAIVAGLLVLAACHGKRREDAPAADNIATENLSSPLPQPTLPPPLPPANASNASAPLAAAPPPEVSEDVQTQEDADAVGLTARSRPETSGAGNETR